MINSISSSGSAMSMSQHSATQRQPPPQGKDAFKASDADGNGLVSKTELSTLAAGIEKVTGETINIDNSLSTYDVNQDGGLSGEELLSMLNALGFSPPDMAGSNGGSALEDQPPPPPSRQAISAYSQNSGDDMMAKLLELLQQQEGAGTEPFTPIDVIS